MKMEYVSYKQPPNAKICNTDTTFFDFFLLTSWLNSLLFWNQCDFSIYFSGFWIGVLDVQLWWNQGKHSNTAQNE